VVCLITAAFLLVGANVFVLDDKWRLCWFYARGVDEVLPCVRCAAAVVETGACPGPRQKRHDYATMTTICARKECRVLKLYTRKLQSDFNYSVGLAKAVIPHERWCRRGTANNKWAMT